VNRFEFLFVARLSESTKERDRHSIRGELLTSVVERSAGARAGANRHRRHVFRFRDWFR
jgi:hypothetical protein